MSALPTSFRPTSRLLSRLLEVERWLGRIEGLDHPTASPQLRRQNRIRTIHSTVGIEGNPLSQEQVTALVEGKRVAGHPREVREVQNAIDAYERAHGLAPWSERTVLRLHGWMMKGLAPDAGRWRTGSVGIFRGDALRHLAPPARAVPSLMRTLIRHLRRDDETPLVIRACLAHYELQFIHPFSDGNGRVGRLWQHVILVSFNPAFEWTPVESLVRQRQRAYYGALARADASGEATAFVEFMLECLRDGLAEVAGHARTVKRPPTSRLAEAEAHFGRRWFTRGDYLGTFRGISTATASRDLHRGVEEGRLERQGTLATSRYRFIRR